MKKLVITADDFGLDEVIDRGIREACEKGAVTHVSLVANGSSTQDAIRFLRNHPEISVGIHLNLTDGMPLSDPKSLRPLLDAEDQFRASHVQAALIIMQQRDLISPVETEYRLQLESLLEHGLRLSQVNSHGHLHGIPELFQRVAGLCVDYKIPYLRTVREPLSWDGLSTSPRRWVKAVLLNNFFSRALSRAKLEEIPKTHPCIGVFDSGCLRLNRLEKLLAGLREGLTEFLCHPGHADDRLRSRYRWGYQWAEELSLLTSREFQNTIRGFQIQTVNFLTEDFHAL